MTNNDILRRLRYALDIGNSGMIEIFALSGHTIELSRLIDLLKKEGDAGYSECSAERMTLFLDGLVLQKRGHQECETGRAVLNDAELTNNAILKKLRIALNLKEDEMITIMKLADVTISKSELSALFRNKNHRHHKVCGDQFLRYFLKGLTIRNRKNVCTRPSCVNPASSV